MKSCKIFCTIVSLRGPAASRAALLVAAVALAACPPPGECVTDTDCAEGEVCRALQESDETVCIVPFTPADAGPDEEDEPVAIASLTADDDVVAAGETTTLRWEANNASSCAFNEGIGGVDASGSVEVTVERTTEYTLSCQGVDGPALASVTVAVAVAVLDLSLDDAEVNIGAEVTATWQAVGATSCTLTAPGVELSVPATDLEAGAATFQPNASGEVVLSCEGEPAPTTASVVVDVARIASFTATPATTTAGGTVTLAWVGEHVTECGVEGVTDDAFTGSEVTVTVDASTDYTVTCNGFDGVLIQSTTTVTVE